MPITLLAATTDADQSTEYVAKYDDFPIVFRCPGVAGAEVGTVQFKDASGSWHDYYVGGNIWTITASGGLHRRLPVLLERDPHIRIGERIPGHQGCDLASLRCIRLQEFQASWDVIKKVFHAHQGALRSTDLFRPGHTSTIHTHTRADGRSGYC